MSVRLRLALTVLLTGLAAAIGVLVAVALAFERVERESTFARANAFVQRVAQQHADLLSQQRQDPETVARFLRSLLLFDPGSQLYLLAPDGTVLTRTGVTPLPPGFKVNMGPVLQAAQTAPSANGDPVAQRGAAYVMGDDPAPMCRATCMWCAAHRACRRRAWRAWRGTWPGRPWHRCWPSSCWPRCWRPGSSVR